VPIFIALGLVSFGWVMAYSATYDPYCADIALPATQDALLLVTFLGVVSAFEHRRWIELFSFTLLTLIGSSGGGLLLATFALGVALGFRQRPWGRIAGLALCVAGSMAVVRFVPVVLEHFHLPPPGGEHDFRALLRKYWFLMVHDVKRLAFLAVPCGVYPVFAVFSWRRADEMTRALLLVSGVTFLAYYVLAHIALHYFVPSMVLPLVAFWRHHRPASWKWHRGKITACAAAALVAIWLAFPEETSIYRGTREVGQRLDTSHVPNYSGSDPGFFKAAELLVQLFPKDYDPRVPEELYGGSPMAWVFYSRRPTGSGTRKSYFLVADGWIPERSIRVAEKDGTALYRLDDGTYERDRIWRPAGSQGPRIFSLSRDVLFDRREKHAALGVIDIRQAVYGFLDHFGIDRK
jgi:hypothetical protein